MPFTKEQKHEYYANNPEARARRNAVCHEAVKRRREDPEYRERERRVNLARYYARKAEAAMIAAELEGGNTLEASNMTVRVN
jgi:hypothetical protein